MNTTNFFFQNSATPIMEGIVDLHNYIFFFLIQIFTIVIVFFFTILLEFGSKPYADTYFGYVQTNRLVSAETFTHYTLLEFFWTIIPTIILVSIAIPSLILLYSIDETIQPVLTVKIVGSQWFWSYEYNDEFVVRLAGSEISFDSYMVPEDDLTIGDHRLLETDNNLVLPTNVHIRLVVSASDVLHSFAVPSLGVKVDAVPGRLNEISVFIKREGVFYGQCSELCGVNHGFMPICVVAINVSDWIDWVIDNSVIVDDQLQDLESSPSSDSKDVAVVKEGGDKERNIPKEENLPTIPSSTDKDKLLKDVDITISSDLNTNTFSLHVTLNSWQNFCIFLFILMFDIIFDIAACYDFPTPPTPPTPPMPPSASCLLVKFKLLGSSKLIFFFLHKKCLLHFHMFLKS